MATKKKTKTKAKKTKKKASARKTGSKKAARRPAAKKATPKKRAPKASKPKPVAAQTTAGETAQPATSTPPSGERIGIVTHYYNHLSVAIIKIESGMLREGETVQIRGHTTDFMQPVESMEVEHVHVSEAGPGQSIGLRVKDHAREHDVVYKVTH